MVSEESMEFPAVQPIHFGAHLADSDAFSRLFDLGMDLVEETATYLDGIGRKESRRLGRVGAMAYATESMRLTSRLMQVASWLLLQRAVNDGEMTDEQACAERSKIRLAGMASATQGPGWKALPEDLQSLIIRSLALQRRVQQLERVISAASLPPSSPNNPVADQIGRISAAFARTI